MSKKKKSESPPIPEPLSVDYAPTGRAACKTCQSVIGDGSVRIGRLVRSRFHDGYDTQLYHWRCGCEYGSSLDDFRGWQSNLRWGGPNDDVERLLSSFGEEFIEDASVIGEYRKRNEWVRSAGDHLAAAPAALLRQVFEANDMVFSDRAKGSQLALVLADTMLFGKLPACPTCNTNGLRQEGTDIRCHGWFSASTKCEFKYRVVNLVKGRPTEFGGIAVGDEFMGSRLARGGQLSIPEDVGIHKAFKTLLIPKELQALKKKQSQNFSTSRGGGVSSSVIATLDSEDEEAEYLEDPKSWLVGMKFVMCGVPHIEQDELVVKILNHGGSVQEDVVVAGPERTTHLVISEEELFRDPKSAKYRKCTDAGIPIVKVDFVIAATDDDSASASRENKDVEVIGRSRKLGNAIINGRYAILETVVSDRPVFSKKSDKHELYLFYSASRGKWKIAPSMNDGAGHLAINSDSKAERPDLCVPEGAWEVFDGKEKGFNKDAALKVVPAGGRRTASLSGPMLRQRKHLKRFVVEGSVGKKLGRIKDLLGENIFGKKKPPRRRPVPIPGSPLVTVDEDAKGGAIYVDSGNNVFNVLLTKTDASTNVNKFYAIQLVSVFSKKSKSSINYSVFRKWGRFGSTNAGPMNGSMSVDYGSDKQSAIDAFKQKFNECTGLDFELRDSVAQKPGRYAYVELAGQNYDEEKEVIKKSRKTTQSSTLMPQVRELIELIFDLQMIEREMSKSMNIDTSRLPPNALSRRQLSQGLSVLREIEAILAPERFTAAEDGKENLLAMGAHLDGPSKQLRLTDCSNRFYTIVPHCFDRKEVIPVIDKLKILKKRIRNIEDLMQIVDLEEIRLSSSAKQENNSLSNQPVADLQYEALECKIDLLDSQSLEFNIISNAVSETHASTHDSYTLRVDKVFKVERFGEADRFASDPCWMAENRKMLWHGSRLSNWASILKNGLRIAPKEAPVTGYMFGKGVYFADSSSKSANYCFATEDEPDGLLVLCDVALGKQYKRLEAQYEACSKCKKKGFDSTWGVGQHAPLLTTTFPDGSVIPSGKLEDNKASLELAKEDNPRGNPSLLYNEYIVYRESQLLMKYIVHVKFDFKPPVRSRG